MRVFLWSVAAFVTYLIIGVVWAWRQWMKFYNGELDFYEREKQRFLLFHRIQGLSFTIPEFLKAEWRNYVQASPRLRSVPPNYEDYTTSIALNFSLWPFSMLFLSGQLIYRFTIERLIVAAMEPTKQKINQVRKDLK
jgi:hypothetical protein